MEEGMKFFHEKLAETLIDRGVYPNKTEAIKELKKGHVKGICPVTRKRFKKKKRTIRFKGNQRIIERVCSKCGWQFDFKIKR